MFSSIFDLIGLPLAGVYKKALRKKAHITDGRRLKKVASSVLKKSLLL